MDNTKLNTKDLINVGIFTVLYFVMFFISGALGYIPIFVVALPFLLGILGGIPFMLLLTKTGKFGAVTIMGILIGLLCFLMGQTWIAVIFGIVFGFLADLILKSGEYKSWGKITVGYSVFTIWVIGSMLPMWIMRDIYFEQVTAAAVNAEYVDSVRALTTNIMLPVIVGLGLIGAVTGAYIGRAALKKHFIRAGIA